MMTSSAGCTLHLWQHTFVWHAPYAPQSTVLSWIVHVLQHSSFLFCDFSLCCLFCAWKVDLDLRKVKQRNIMLSIKMWVLHWLRHLQRKSCGTGQLQIGGTLLWGILQTEPQLTRNETSLAGKKHVPDIGHGETWEMESEHQLTTQ